uniref:Uncharacterized protein n=1 Tax=viral metagenome TaxID=1070528 RepID=A0A6C0JDS2_9ZZZZ
MELDLKIQKCFDNVETVWTNKPSNLLDVNTYFNLNDLSEICRKYFTKLIIYDYTPWEDHNLFEYIFHPTTNKREQYNIIKFKKMFFISDNQGYRYPRYLIKLYQYEPTKSQLSKRIIVDVP